MTEQLGTHSDACSCDLCEYVRFVVARHEEEHHTQEQAVSQEPAFNTLYAEYELPALYELAHYTLRIIGEHTSRYEQEYLQYSGYALTQAEQERFTRIMTATQGDIDAMLGQYKRIMQAIYSRG